MTLLLVPSLLLSTFKNFHKHSCVEILLSYFEVRHGMDCRLEETVRPNRVFKTNFINNSEEVSYEFDLYDDLTTLVLNYSSVLQRVLWNNQSLKWLLIKKHPSDSCESYGQWGPNAICIVNDPQICSCLAGYVPKSLQDWDTLVWSCGCVLKNPLNCPKGEGFIKLKCVEIPDLLQFRMNTSMTPKECKVECLKNCSCTGYANSNTTGDGRGCLLWYGDLLDIEQFPVSGNQDLYIRVTASELENATCVVDGGCFSLHLASFGKGEKKKTNTR
ncbi:hypothetical protein F0562_013664 [Nyssa sinensis]|uniref:Apple domain-containing protein n=1 Tax=Nyssa sinensis TaxID=561372 RepID=A0A5J4ZP11_9ASTE|nr:hypothetical protein F0562_013664 [Nyssa sinensis]